MTEHTVKLYISDRPSQVLKHLSTERSFWCFTSTHNAPAAAPVLCSGCRECRGLQELVVYARHRTVYCRTEGPIKRSPPGPACTGLSLWAARYTLFSGQNSIYIQYYTSIYDFYEDAYTLLNARQTRKLPVPMHRIVTANSEVPSARLAIQAKRKFTLHLGKQRTHSWLDLWRCKRSELVLYVTAVHTSILKTGALGAHYLFVYAR